MKKFLTSRTGAIVLTVVIILLSTYFGAYRSLTVKVGEIADGFNEGVYYTDDSGNTFQHKSIRSQLINRSEASINLVDVADTFDDAQEEAKALREAYNNLRNLLYNDGTPAQLCAANKELTTAFDALHTVLAGEALDTKDAKRIADYMLEMDGAADEIEASGYNESVREFNRSTLSVFPTNILKSICFVDAPELFE